MGKFRIQNSEFRIQKSEVRRWRGSMSGLTARGVVAAAIAAIKARASSRTRRFMSPLESLLSSE
jgi:hypothetical protein